MTLKDFSELLERRISLIKNTLDKKSAEYSTDKDKLHNFKETGRRRNQHPSESLQGMLEKHLTSYYDILEGIKSGKKYSREMLDEKLGDIINYFILQEALFVEYGLKVEDIKPLYLDEIIKMHSHYLDKCKEFRIKPMELGCFVNLVTEHYQEVLFQGYKVGDLSDKEKLNYDPTSAFRPDTFYNDHQTKIYNYYLRCLNLWNRNLRDGKLNQMSISEFAEQVRIKEGVELFKGYKLGGYNDTSAI